METLSFSQDELKLLMAIINKAFQQGGLGSGDALQFAPIIQKLKDKIKLDPPVEEGAVVNTLKN